MEYWIHSLGGKATAKKNRSEAIAEYYSNPNKCLQCGEVIHVKDGVSPSQARRKTFCDKQCAALYRENTKKEEGVCDEQKLQPEESPA